MSHPLATIGTVETIPFEQAPSMRFAAAARALADSCRAQSLQPIAFRSPPHSDDVDRSIRRTRAGVTVAVRIRSRHFEAVLADMIDGVVTANELDAAKASKVRSHLWESVLVAPSVKLAA